MREYKNPNWRGPRQGRVDRVSPRRRDPPAQERQGQLDLAQVPTVGGALVALAPTDGAIRAMSGGYAFEWSKFNRVTDARRQPGSTFKPFVYAAALGKGYTPASLVSDTQKSFGRWKPKNADGKYMGTIRMRVALAKSRNLAIINLIDRMGVDYTRDFIQRFGYTMDDMPRNYAWPSAAAARRRCSWPRPTPCSPTAATRSSPTSSAHRGRRGQSAVRGRATARLRRLLAGAAEGRGRGAALDEAGSPLAQQVLDPRIAYNMDSMLKDVIKVGTARRALQLNRSDLAGKTGTTNDAATPGSPATRRSSSPSPGWAWTTTARSARRVGRHRRARHVGGLHGRCAGRRAHRQDQAPRGHGCRCASVPPPVQATKGGGVLEYIRSEYQLMTLGAGAGEVRRCVGRVQRREHVTAPCSARQRSAPKRSAPRVMDSLF
jgi:penicillin-binding protein 1A